jgi:hypothetical protein
MPIRTTKNCVDPRVLRGLASHLKTGLHFACLPNLKVSTSPLESRT